MKILITGKTGQVGRELQHSLSSLGDIVAMDHSELDLTMGETGLRETIRGMHPDIVINAAAYTAVDRAEDDPDVAFLVNGVAPGILASESSKCGALFIHYSTDYVFSGEKRGPYIESDVTGPKSIYGKSKLAGERAVSGECDQHIILRTSWVFSAHGGNFLKTILRLSKVRSSISVVDDQFGAPTSAMLIADITARLVKQYQRDGKGSFPYGLYHLASDQATSWHAYACHIINIARALNPTLQLLPESVQPICTKDYGAKAPRPLNSVLNTEKIRTTFKLSLPHWKDDVDKVIEQLL